MNFYIKKIKLWFKHNRGTKEYVFDKDKVNVITGDSSTGKSSILSIIDYCLLSGVSNIVEDVINENIEWYGLSFNLRDIDYVIIRKNPKDGGSNQIYFEQTDNFPLVFEPNSDRGQLIMKLNELFGSPRRTYNVIDRQISTTFRSFLSVNYLTEDAIATQNTYFDTKFFKDPDIDAIISEITKISIGIDEQQKHELETKLLELRKKLDDENNRRARVENKVSEYEEKLKVLFSQVVDLGICEQTDDACNIESLQCEISKALDFYDKVYNSKEQFKQISELRKKRTIIKRNLEKCNSLRDDIVRYNEYIDQVEDSLLPIDFITKHLDDVVYYEDTRRLIENLKATLENVRKNGRHKKAVPEDLLAQIERYQLEYQKINNEFKKQNVLLRKSMDVDWLMKLIQLKHTYETMSKPQRAIMSDAEYINLEQEIKNVQQQLEQLVTNKDERLSALNNRIKDYFSVAHGLSDAYNSCLPRFDIEHQALYLKREGEEFVITNVGSKCNYMFMHLCTFLGIHEHAIKEGIDYIPSFMFIDQPSIPFYADNSDGDIKDNDDKKRLGYAFNLINIFMDRIIRFIYKHPFQIILIEHADSSYWQDKYPNFETRYEFVKGKDSGLIPDFIYPKQ